MLLCLVDGIMPAFLGKKDCVTLNITQHLDTNQHRQPSCNKVYAITSHSLTIDGFSKRPPMSSLIKLANWISRTLYVSSKVWHPCNRHKSAYLYHCARYWNERSKIWRAWCHRRWICSLWLRSYRWRSTDHYKNLIAYSNRARQHRIVLGKEKINLCQRSTTLEN